MGYVGGNKRDIYVRKMYEEKESLLPVEQSI